ELLVHPAWWLTWWAFLVYVGAVVLFANVVNRLRVRNLQRKNRELAVVVDARTEEIRAQARQLEALDRMVEAINRELVVENVLKSLLEQGMKLSRRRRKRRSCSSTTTPGGSRSEQCSVTSSTSSATS